MHDVLIRELQKQAKPIDIIVAGLGFMGLGFISGIRYVPGMRVAVVISRRPNEAVQQLLDSGMKAVVEHSASRMHDNISKGIISVTDSLDIISTFENSVVLEVTGTVSYGTEIALQTITAKKHLVTMNPELQATVGSELKKYAEKEGVLLTDVIGDQPGSLSRLIHHSRMLGYKVLLAGNMKRYMDRHATQAQMKHWAEDKGLAVRQTVSFTDGTKQSIEMTLVANYFGYDLLQFGMRGAEVSNVQDALTAYNWDTLPKNGVVDYVLGRTLFPGVFAVVEHMDKNQQKYLRYLGLGDGPRYVLFEPYHLCHLEVPGTIAKVMLFGQETINNSIAPRATTIAVAKLGLSKGSTLDGIGGDTVYGNIDTLDFAEDYLPIGLAENAVVVNNLHQDQPIKLSDVILPDNAATRLLGLSSHTVKTQSSHIATSTSR